MGTMTWQEISLDVGWGSLRGKRCVVGDGSTSEDRLIKLFCLHGWLDNANTFDTLIPLLPMGIEVVTLDLPGHGHSDHLPVGAHYNPMGYVVNVRAALLELGWDRFMFLAHSMGAYIANYYAALYPEDVEAIIQLDFLFPRHPQDRVATWRAETKMILKSELQGRGGEKRTPRVYQKDEVIGRLVKARQFANNTENIDKAAAEILLPRSTRPYGNGYIWSHDEKARTRFLLLYGLDNWLYIISRVKCPVMLLAANFQIAWLESQPDLPFKITVEAYERSNKMSVFRTVEGQHHMHLTHPHRVAPLIKDFMFQVVDSRITTIKAKL